MNNMPKISTAPAMSMRYVRLPLFCTFTGYTEKAVRLKIDRGQWLEGLHYRKAPDGHIMMDLEAYNKWVEGALAV